VYQLVSLSLFSRPLSLLPMQRDCNARPFASQTPTLALAPHAPAPPAAHLTLTFTLTLALGLGLTLTHDTHRALELAPHDHKIHNNLGLLLSESGRLADAAASFSLALAILPGEAMYHNNLGSVHWRAEELPEAEERFRTALRLQPDYASAMKNLVLLLHRQDSPSP